MGEINTSDKIMFKYQKQRKNMEIKIFLHKAPSKRLFWNGIHSLLRRAHAEEALTSFTVSDAYRYFAGQA